MGLEEEDYSGRLCPLFEQRCGSESVGGGGDQRKTGGSGGIRGKKFLAAAQPEAENMERFSRHSVTSHPFSPVIILPRAEDTLRLSGTRALLLAQRCVWLP